MSQARMPKNKFKQKAGQTHSCKKKRRFRDRTEAKEASKRIPVPMRIYECNYCKGWHLTSRLVETMGKKKPTQR